MPCLDVLTKVSLTHVMHVLHILYGPMLYTMLDMDQGHLSWVTCPGSLVLRHLSWVTSPGSPVLGHLS